MHFDILEDVKVDLPIYKVFSAVDIEKKFKISS